MNPIALALPLVLNALSPSKLGPYVLGDPMGTAATRIVSACPRIAHWEVDGTNNVSVANQIASYRALCPGGTVVLSVAVAAYAYTPVDWPLAASAADDYWSRMSPNLAAIDFHTVDWLEGPRGTDVVPGWEHNLTIAWWYADFWQQLASHMNNAGFKPLVGSIEPGEPGSAEELGGTNAFKPIADRMIATGLTWAWSYQAYSANLTQSESVELDGALHYRTVRDECGLGNVPLVLTEAGQGYPGWKVAGTTEQTYLSWLYWFDQRLAEDTHVVGATLFQVGDDTTYAAYDLSSMTDALVDYLAHPAAPAGCDAGACDGGTGSVDGGTTGGSITHPPGEGTPSNPDPGFNTCGCQSASAGGLLGIVPALLALVRNRRRG